MMMCAFWNAFFERISAAAAMVNDGSPYSASVRQFSLLGSAVDFPPNLAKSRTLASTQRLRRAVVERRRRRSRPDDTARQDFR